MGKVFSSVTAQHRLYTSVTVSRRIKLQPSVLLIFGNPPPLSLPKTKRHKDMLSNGGSAYRWLPADWRWTT
jgi:hypothetical protein